jgi:ABC-type branched-subunit amino acid transport system permease subunit
MFSISTACGGSTALLPTMVGAGRLVAVTTVLRDMEEDIAEEVVEAPRVFLLLCVVIYQRESP